MAFFLAPALVLTPPVGFEPHDPVILWDNQVREAYITADSETADDPITNAANPGTDNVWTAATATDPITINVVLAGDGLIQAVGIGYHNLGSTGCSVAIWGKTAEEGAVFVELNAASLLGNDEPAFLRISDVNLAELELRLVPNGTAPFIGAYYAGEVLTLDNGIEVGHTPISDGDDVTLMNGYSQGSRYLGSIVTAAKRSSNPTIRLIDPDYYQARVRPFIRAFNRGVPFFYSWDGRDAGYCWASASTKPVISQRTGEYDVTLPMDGIAT